MNDLNHQESELVAIGAAMGSNCIPCIEFHIPEARKAGLTDSQISAAIRLADKVRQVPARKVLNAAQRMLPETSPGDPAASNPEVSAPAAAGEACCA
jgi:4-carboxymuconolactone decarboxylase